MTMKDFLRNKYGSEFDQEGDNEGNVRHSNAAELAEYLKEEPRNPDLSGVDFDDEIEIRLGEFDSFSADICDFAAGFTMSDCRIKDDLSFHSTYCHQSFCLTGTKVGGDFFYPQNLPDLIAEDDPLVLQITDLEVKGETYFQAM